MNPLQSIKILYLCHGRAGYEALQILQELGVMSGNLMVVAEDEAVNDRIKEKAGLSWSPIRLNDAEGFRKVAAFGPDFIVSMHFRHLVPAKVLALAPRGGINLHPSLLPKYRGCFSAPWVIINGEKETGITFHFMNEKFDDGRIVLQKVVPLHGNETGYSLFESLIDVGLSAFREAVETAVKPGFRGMAQNGSRSYYPRKVPFDGVIDPNWDDAMVQRFLRAMEFPGKSSAVVLTAGGPVHIHTFDEYCRWRNKVLL